MIYSTEQKAIWNAFIIGRNHFVVQAKAGSGKTFTSIEGLNRANAARSLYCVFNKKNQLEAEKKITNKKVQVSTYHSLGFRIILNQWRGVRANGYTEFGRIKSLAPDAPAQVHFQVSKLVSFIKNTCVSVPNLKDATDICLLRGIEVSSKTPEWDATKLAELAINSVALSLQYPQDKQISFDDMVFLPVANGWVKPCFNLVVSDESQDLSAPQLAMLRGLCEAGGRICLIGDSHQAIYGFRGAVQNSIEKFQTELGADGFTLSTSYRCPKLIIAKAQSLVPDIKAAPDAIDGEISNINHETMLNSIKVNDVVLSRSNAPLTKSCLVLLRKNKPAYIVGKEIGKQLITLIDNLEAKDITEFYVKLEAWLTIKQANVTTWNANQAALAVDTVETLKLIGESCLTIDDIKTKINKLFLDSENVRVPSVVLSTVHKAKGLEWENVHLLSWTFSGKRQMTPEQAQEERNILYTAITRSKNKLNYVSQV